MSQDISKDEKGTGIFESLKDVVSNFTETVKETAETVKDKTLHVAETIKDYVTIPANEVAETKEGDPNFSGKLEGEKFLEATTKNTVDNASKVFESTKLEGQDLRKPLDKLSNEAPSMPIGEQISQKGQEMLYKAKGLIHDTKETFVERGHKISEKASELGTTAKDFIGMGKDNVAQKTSEVSGIDASTEKTTPVEENLTPPFDPNADYVQDSKQKMAEMGQTVITEVKDFDQLVKEMAAQNINPDLK